MKTYISETIFIDIDKMNNKELQKHLLAAIQQDSEITDPTNISVDITEEKHTKARKIELIGRVNNEMDKSRAWEIVKKNTNQKTKVVNNINIDPDFNTPGV